MNYAGLIYNDSRHYIDHLAPFCALLGCPLIVCEPSVAKLVKQYYPDLEVIEKGYWNLTLPPSVIACETPPLFQLVFPNQKCRVLWLPHGNSDKGWNVPIFDSIKETAFAYGQQMVDRMSAKQIFRIGNFRFEYFLKHQKFYETMVDIPQKGKNILYAPTWHDEENNGSFWDAFPELIHSLPGGCNLLVKLHPKTLQKFEAELEILMGRITKKNIIFLDPMPPIYPLLSRCDVYIGDKSSIGYDFLTFDRPMYFLNANQNFPLHRCGHSIEPKTFCFKDDPFSSLRRATYKHVFDPTPNWKQLTRSLRGG